MSPLLRLIAIFTCISGIFTPKSAYTSELDTTLQSHPYREIDFQDAVAHKPYQVAPSPGLYNAIAIYQKGQRKNIEDIALFGQSVSLTFNPDHSCVFNLLGVNIHCTYDSHYLYAEDGAPLPYLWDGHTVSASFHHLDFFLQATTSGNLTANTP